MTRRSDEFAALKALLSTPIDEAAALADHRRFPAALGEGLHTRPDGTTFAVVWSRSCGDYCYDDKDTGWFWHNLDPDCAIATNSIAGPFSTAHAAFLAAMEIDA